MIDKQKLLQWISDKQYVYSVDGEDSQEQRRIYHGMLKVLSMLERDIESGEFGVEEVAHERISAPSIHD